MILKKWVVISIFLGLAVNSLGQKLLKIQEVSLRAPDNIKIDGIASEWGYKFQAYNPTNRIFYTISNDDNNLYLIVQATELHAIEKIITGGISLTIKSPDPTTEKSKGKHDIVITFPTSINPRKTEAVTDILYFYKRLCKDTINNGKKIDSLKSVANNKLIAYFREIKVTGIKEITEPVISLSNTEKIYTSAQFNSHLNYTYELSVPLKYIGTALNGNPNLRYSIKLNGIPVVASNGIPSPVLDSPDPEYLYTNTPTALSGNYKLNKK